MGEMADYYIDQMLSGYATDMEDIQDIMAEIREHQELELKETLKQMPTETKGTLFNVRT